eukprot:TRINITY_DN3584_c0_g1_i1.p3 TRINITY_DN3584_c0_g1~~TRINITY_DN3584_c0_g1_i1.p3  ORF type:complete len:160 (-),score=4.21 TRINITY_DN3584_c0_g1_i1:288-767(-)
MPFFPFVVKVVTVITLLVQLSSKYSFVNCTCKQCPIDQVSTNCDKYTCPEQSAIQDIQLQITEAFENNEVTTITTIKYCPLNRIGDFVPTEFYVLEPRKDTDYNPHQTSSQSYSASIGTAEQDEQFSRGLRKLLQDIYDDADVDGRIIGIGFLERANEL